MKKTHLLVLGFTAFVGACQPVIANRGNILDPDILAEIKPGVTTREQVATKLGTPTSISAVDEKTWYYIGRITQQYSFLSPSVIKQQAVEIDFNDEGVVTASTTLDLSKAAEASPVERETPTYGHELTIWRELLGDLSHPMPDLKGNTHSGQ